MSHPAAARGLTWKRLVSHPCQLLQLRHVMDLTHSREVVNDGTRQLVWEEQLVRQRLVRHGRRGVLLQPLLDGHTLVRVPVRGDHRVA